MRHFNNPIDPYWQILENLSMDEFSRNLPIRVNDYESFYMTHMIFTACSRSSTLLCAYAECLKSRIFASFITPVILFILIMIHNYDSFI